jgi:2-keto-4-pentenoate hydratase/2-oxohepta-3-ene-1,7-dioic acid hydratase in catechol pathway
LGKQWLPKAALDARMTPSMMENNVRLASIRLDGAIFPVLVQGDGLLPLAEPDIKSIVTRLGRGDNVALARSSRAHIPYDSAVFVPPLPDPEKIICLGLNYRDHAAEGGHQIPDYPALFIRTSRSFVGHREALIRPSVSERFDYEAELVVVVGRTCRRATRETGLDYVFGYTLMNDGSVRDYQRKSTQWTAGKNFDRSGSIGPVIVSKEELPPGAIGLPIRCVVNDQLLQSGNTGDMIFSVADAIAILSEIMTLQPGDLIAMGTPAGVGFARKPPVWLKTGDVCAVEIDGIGKLMNTVRDEDYNAV